MQDVQYLDRRRDRDFAWIAMLRFEFLSSCLSLSCLSCLQRFGSLVLDPC